jgi:hypothetical protein
MEKSVVCVLPPVALLLLLLLLLLRDCVRTVPRSLCCELSCQSEAPLF